MVSCLPISHNRYHDLLTKYARPCSLKRFNYVNEFTSSVSAENAEKIQPLIFVRRTTTKNLPCLEGYIFRTIHSISC